MSEKFCIKKIFRRVLVILVALAVASTTGLIGAAPSMAADAEYPLTLPNMPLHDPYIVADPTTQTYYLYTANQRTMTGSSARGVMAYQSKNLRDWSVPTLVYTVPSGGWANANQAPWAPEVHYYEGKYYLFTTNHNNTQVLKTASTAGQACGDCGQVWQNQSRRSTIIAVSDTPTGPFTDLDPSKPVTNPSLMTLDGTLYTDPDGTPWMVYAHEWIQKIDGTIEAIPLTKDLKSAAGDPIYLFKGSDAPWYSDPVYGAPLNTSGESLTWVNDVQLPPYVTDGPELHHTPNGSLVMLWTTYRKHNQEYVETQAISRSGKLSGPWEQLNPIVTGNKGHGMIFTTFEGKTMLVLHNNMNRPNVRAELYDIVITDNGVKILAHREDLDGVAGVAIEDTTAPRLFLPPNQVVNATGPSGAVIQYRALAKDDVDIGAIEVTSSKASGTVFPIGSTQVAFSAKDSSGNSTTPVSVQFYVKGAAEQIDDQIELALQVKNEDLADRLRSVKVSLADNNKNQARSTLTTYISKVNAQKGSALTVSMANDLAANASRILSVLSDPPASNDGSSPSDSSGSGSPATSTPVTPQTSDGTISVPTPAVQNGVAETRIDETSLNNALNSAAADNAGIKKVIIDIPAAAGASEYRQTLPAAGIVSGSALTRININTEIADVEVPGNMFGNTAIQSGTVSLSIARANVDELAPEIAKQIGDRPVIELSAYAGSEKISWNNAAAPVKVAVKYKPQDAAEVRNGELITVWYIDGAGNVIPVTNARYNAVTGEIVFTTTHFSKYAAVYSPKEFSDLKGYAWAEYSIKVMASKGAVYGTKETVFSPSANITRADYLDFLISTLDLHADFTDNFADVSKTDKYYNAIGIARKLGIVIGTGNNRFEPNTPIIREDQMVMTAKALKLAKGLSDGSDGDLAAFKDKDKISGTAKASVAALIKSGIIQGAYGNIYPKANTTRAEAAVIMYRLYNK